MLPLCPMLTPGKLLYLNLNAQASKTGSAPLPSLICYSGYKLTQIPREGSLAIRWRAHSEVVEPQIIALHSRELSNNLSLV